jgi:hypothetical protein
MQIKWKHMETAAAKARVFMNAFTTQPKLKPNERKLLAQ